MALGQQAKMFSGFQTKSSKDSTTFAQLLKLVAEYERLQSLKNKDINTLLSIENIILKSFDENEYKDLIDNTDFDYTKSSSNYNDIYTTTPILQAGNFINGTGINVTFLMEKEEWIDYYKDVENFIKDYLGKDFKTLSSVIQFDEFIPHLQIMGIFRTEIMTDEFEKDINEKRDNNYLSKQFSLYNKKNKGTDNYIDPIANKKQYKEAKEEWIQNNRDELLKNRKSYNLKKGNKKYAYIQNNNPLASKYYSYKDYQEKLYEFNKEHPFIKELVKKMTKIRGKEVSFVKNTQEAVYDGYSNSHTDMKKQMKKEYNIIIDKIKNNEELTDLDMTRLINFNNREKLKIDFLKLNPTSWKEQFKNIEYKNISSNFENKISTDFMNIVKDILKTNDNKQLEQYTRQSQRLIELNDNVNDKEKKINEMNSNIETLRMKQVIENDKLEKLKSKVADDTKTINEFYNYNDLEILQKSKDIFNSLKPSKTFGLENGNYTIPKDKVDDLKNLIKLKISNYNDFRNKYQTNISNVLNLLNYNSNSELGIKLNLTTNNLSNIYKLQDEISNSFSKLKKKIDKEKTELKNMNDEKIQLLVDKRVEELKPKIKEEIKKTMYDKAKKEYLNGTIEITQQDKDKFKASKIASTTLITKYDIEKYRRNELSRQINISDEDIEEAQDNAINNIINNIDDDTQFFLSILLHEEISDKYNKIVNEDEQVYIQQADNLLKQHNYDEKSRDFNMLAKVGIGINKIYQKLRENIKTYLSKKDRY